MCSGAGAAAAGGGDVNTNVCLAGCIHVYNVAILVHHVWK